MENTGHVPSLYNLRAASRSTVTMAARRYWFDTHIHTHNITKNDLKCLWSLSWGWPHFCCHSDFQRWMPLLVPFYLITHHLVSLLLSLNNEQGLQVGLQALLKSILPHWHSFNFPDAARVPRDVRAWNLGTK